MEVEVQIYTVFFAEDQPIADTLLESPLKKNNESKITYYYY
jgi:hypothetical protein